MGSKGVATPDDSFALKSGRQVGMLSEGKLGTSMVIWVFAFCSRREILELVCTLMGVIEQRGRH